MSSADKPTQAAQPKQKSITSFFCKTSTPAAPARPSDASPVSSSSSSLKPSAEKAEKDSAAKAAATSAEKEKPTPTDNNTNSNTDSNVNSSGKKPRQQTQRKPRASSASKKSAAKTSTAAKATPTPTEQATTPHNAPSQQTSPSAVVVVDMSGAEASRDSAVSDVFASMERETHTHTDTHTDRERHTHRESDLGLSESDVGEDQDIDRLVSTQTHTQTLSQTHSQTERETLTLTYSQASISSEGNTVNSKATASPSPLRRSPPTLSSPVFSPPQRRTPREALSAERETERLLMPCELSSFYVSPAATNVSAVCVAERDAQRVRESVTSMGVSERATLVEALRRTQRESEREKERVRETVTPVASDSKTLTDTLMDTHTDTHNEDDVHAVAPTDTNADSGSAEVHTAIENDTHTVTDTHTGAPASESHTTPSHNGEGRGKRTPKPVRAFDPTPVSMRCVKPKTVKTASDKAASDANSNSESVICVDMDVEEEEEEKAEREKDEEYTHKATPSRSTSNNNNSNANTGAKKSRSAKKDKESGAGEKEKEKEKEKELTPEQKQRIEKLQERMLQVANDMAAVEKCDDMRDNRLELDDLVSQFHAFISQPHNTQTPSQTQSQTETVSEGDATPAPSPPQTVTQPQSAETATDTASDVLRRRCREFVRVVLARCVQGSARPLSQLAQEVCETLKDLRAALVQENETECENETERERLSTMLHAIDELCGAPPQSNGSAADPSASSAPSFSLAAVCEEVKTVAQRESLGVRPPQCASPFEDDSPTALWRWEVFPPHSTTLCCVRESSHTALREAKQWRGKCARVVRSLAQLVTHTLTAPPPPPTGTETETVTVTQLTDANAQAQIETQTDAAAESSPTTLAETSQPQTSQSAHAQHESKRALLEERLGKAVSEVEKYKERRRALEAKKTEKDAKLAEKEAKKAAALEAKKNEKEAKLAEKEAKKSVKTVEVKRQQNALLGFLRVQAPAKTTTQAQTPTASPSPLTVTHTDTHTAVSSQKASTQHAVITQDDVACAKETATALSCDERERRRESFLRTLLYGSDADTQTDTHTQAVKETALSEILAEHQRLRSERERERREMPRPHRTVRIMVTVTAQHAQSQTQTQSESLFADDPQCELCERVVSRRVKTLRFHEDVRPAYVGTHTLRLLNSRNTNTASLVTSVVTGRTPLAKDLSRLDYEYDSEADWSDCEGDDGEDLGLTDDEEDEENDDLEYDDMFRRDDDFGSDEEDGLCDDPRVVRASCVEEVLGPLWLSGRSVWYDNVCGNNNSHTGVCVSSSLAECVLYTDTLGEREEAKRLACFPTVVFAHTLSSSQNAQSQPHTLLRLCGEREVDGAPVKKKARKNENENVGGSESIAGDSMKGFDETKLSDLLHSVHGKKDGIEKLIALFVATHTNISKAAVRRRIGQVAEKTKDKDGNGSARFIVKKELLEAHCPELLQSEVSFTPVSSRKKKRVSVEESATESAKKKQPRLSLTQTPTKTQIQAQTTPVAVSESERDRETAEEPSEDVSPTQTQTQTRDDDDCVVK